ncbi:MAG: LTA synthase family protein [Chitinophagaceae bacterium]|nr:MAG: LTA synthase family protein [Chitinophagaceae bacterium]
MLARTRLPKTLLWVINLLFIYLVLFTGMRMLMLALFKPASESVHDLLPSFFLGLRYDLRWISIVLLPILLLSLWQRLSPFYAERNKKLWTWYLAAMTFFIVFFFAADFGCFAYNQNRLGASALNFAEDAKISARMLWQSYPIVWMVGGLVVAVLVLRWIFWRTHFYVVSRTDGRGIPYRRKLIVAGMLALGFFLYGSPSATPLQWKAAFGLHDSFRAFLALNPLQNFFTTLRFRKPQPNEAEARAAFPAMKQWMGLESDGFYYQRPVEGKSSKRPNVVLVVCESFSMYKSSLSGNPLNTTPYVNGLAQQGLLFDRCFSPHFSTARGLFATLSGIPDVQLSKFSTRNPEALDQHTIVNDFEGYGKYYFLGGDPGFNNFKGLVQNIDDVHMVTEGQFKKAPVNVWGISDKDLFLAADEMLAKQKDPFFAIIQTADNHRPFTIPPGETGFHSLQVPADTLKKYGFESEAEYNAFRYSDYCIQVFMEAARKQAYFDNTIFVFVGDHGVSGDATAMYGADWDRLRLTDEHVPLLFYAPKLVPAQRRHEVVSQIDVLPTVAGLAGISYTNTTLGRDLLGSKSGNYAFIIYHDGFQIGMVTDSFYYTRNLQLQKDELTPLPGMPAITATQKAQLRARMAPATQGFYETARWMLLNNKKAFVKR